MRRARTSLLATVALLVVPGVGHAADGDLIEFANYGGAAQDLGRDIVATADGGVSIVGRTTSVGPGGFDVYLAKVDAAGVVEWEHGFGTVAHDEPEALAQTPGGGYIVAGNRNIGSANTTDALLLEVDAAGNEVWQRTYGGDYEDKFFDVANTADGGFVMVGTTLVAVSAGHRPWLVKVDADGDVQWESTTVLSSGGRDYLRSVVEAPGGGFVASGYNSTGTFPEFDAKLARFDASGTLLWVRTFDHSIDDRGYDLAIAPAGGYVIGGPSGGAMSIWRTDASGELMWRQTFNTPTGDNGLGVLAASDGGFLVAGYTYTYEVADYQVYLGKTDADGAPLWEREYGGVESDVAWAIDQTPTGNYVLVGTTQSMGEGGDLLVATVDGTSATSVTPESVKAWLLAESLVAYPNPFHPETRVSFRLAEPAPVSISVIDVRGRRVRTLLAGERLSPGPHELLWDGTDDTGRSAAPGVYFLRARVGDEGATRRLVLSR